MELTGRLAELAAIARQKSQSSEISYEQQQQRAVDQYNSGVGDMTGYNCDICKNKGYTAVLQHGAFCLVECKCMAVRRSNARLEKSGINPAYTLQNYNADNDWQRSICMKAYEYADAPKGWFFMGGQVGSGKTHICTGIVRKLINSGREARYMLWRDDSTAIKATVKYPEEYAAMVEPLKTVDVLYIDDFLKTNSGQPTTADFNLAFEILNARYNRPDLVTIISSEFYLSEIADLDEAVGSRIYERSKGYAFNIGRDRAKNYRLRGLNGGF